MSMGNLWNDTDRVKQLYLEKPPSQCCFVHHKAHIHWTRIEPGPLRLEASD